MGAQQSLPFQGRWLGGTPRRRGCGKFDTTSQSASQTAPLREEALGCAPHGFPYEGKLSAVRLTDEVGAAA